MDLALGLTVGGLTVSFTAGCGATQANAEAGASPAAASNAERPEVAAAPAQKAGASGCEQALLCEDFEQHAVGQAPGAPFEDATGDSGASVQVSEQRAFSGSRSVHVQAPTGAAYRRGYFAVHGPPVFPAASREMYGRLMVFVEAAPITPEGQPAVHWTLFQGEGRDAQDEYNAIYRYGGQHQSGSGLMANFETTPPVRTDCWQHSARQLPIGQWACVRWYFSAEKNQMELWLDNEQVTDLSVVGRGTGPSAGCLGNDLNGEWRAPPAFQSLYVGWERYQEPTNDRNVWIDDLAVSLTPLECPAQ